MRKSALLLPILAVVVIGILSSLYIVDEREKALVLQFGQIKKVVDEPGLGVKVPLIQEVVRYDRRILSLDTDAIEVTPSDDRRLVVDAFTRYRIADVVQFRQAVGIGAIDMRRAIHRMNDHHRSVGCLHRDGCEFAAADMRPASAMDIPAVLLFETACADCR